MKQTPNIEIWSKSILTIIATALCIIVVQSAVVGPAGAAFGDCGSHGNPCYIKITDSRIYISGCLFLHCR